MEILQSYKNTKRPGTLNMMVFGDCHLGNNLNKAHEMIVGLMSFFKSPKFVAELDAIFIEGDLFDAGLSYNHDALPEIQTFMCWLLRKCYDNNIILRVLEGTPSHDNKQSKNFEVLLSSMQIDLDFKYVDDMIIEEHPILGSILYVPDEWSTSAEHTYTAASKLISVYGINKVDFILMHGAFDHQLPPPHHNGNLWQDLVNHAIFVGHIHTPSIHGKIIAAGSTDRCEHGNEEPKGAVHYKYTNGITQIKQIENVHAKKFVTIDCRELSVEDMLARIAEYTNLPKGSFLRLHVKKTDNSSTAIKFLSVEHPQFVWSQKIDSDETEVINTSGILPEVNLVSMSVTKNNIQSVIMDYGKNYHQDISEADLMLACKKIGDLCTEN